LKNGKKYFIDNWIRCRRERVARVSANCIAFLLSLRSFSLYISIFTT
jgi:hypothetical protein